MSMPRLSPTTHEGRLRGDALRLTSRLDLDRGQCCSRGDRVRRGDQLRHAVRRCPGLDSARRFQPVPVLAAGHLQGPESTVATDTDHLLSLVKPEYRRIRTGKSPAVGYRRPTLLMLAMHVPLPAVALPLLA